MEHCAARGEDRAAAGIERAIGMLITWRRVRMVSRGWRRVWAQSLARDPAHIFSEKVRESFQALPLKEHFEGGGVVFFGLGGLGSIFIGESDGDQQDGRKRKKRHGAAGKHSALLLCTAALREELARSLASPTGAGQFVTETEPEYLKETICHSLSLSTEPECRRHSKEISRVPESGDR